MVVRAGGSLENVEENFLEEHLHTRGREVQYSVITQAQLQQGSASIHAVKKSEVGFHGGEKMSRLAARKPPQPLVMYLSCLPPSATSQPESSIAPFVRVINFTQALQLNGPIPRQKTKLTGEVLYCCFIACNCHFSSEINYLVTPGYRQCSVSLSLSTLSRWKLSFGFLSHSIKGL